MCVRSICVTVGRVVNDTLSKKRRNRYRPIAHKKCSAVSDTNKFILVLSVPLLPIILPILFHNNHASVP